MNSKILAALDNIFTKDCDNLDSVTSMFQNVRFCSNNEAINCNNNSANRDFYKTSDSMIRCMDSQTNFKTSNLNNNNSGNDEIINSNNFQSMLPNHLMIGNSKPKNMFKTFLELNNNVSLSDSSMLHNVDFNSNELQNNFRKSTPIQCLSSDCAQTLMKFKLPDFVKTSSNKTPSMTLAELDTNKLKFLTRINKVNEYGAEQFISYKFDLHSNGIY